MTPRWHRAALMPSWIRWLPCAFAYLTVVPAEQPFRRSTWDGVVPWGDSAWCDPGDVEEWVARARQRCPRREADEAERRAREHYAWILQVRSARIDLFGEMCRRRSVPVPHTVEELFSCLVVLGLLDLDDAEADPWVRTRLDRNPLDVLPLHAEERDLEERAQRDDRAVLVAIAVRRLAQRARRRWRRRTFSTSVAGLAMMAGVTPDQTRQSLGDLTEIAQLRIEAHDVEGWLRLTVPWPDFRLRFPFAELPAPEHAV